MDDVTTLRRFNRSFTQRIGVLDESYLGSGRALGPSRVLYEIEAEGTRIADLRDRLGLDSGYTSRLLRTLEADGLVTVERDPDDGRQRVVRLTASGIGEQRRIDELAEQHARRLLDGLSDRHRAELGAALATADRLLAAAAVRFEVVDPRSPGARFAVGEYFRELDTRFRDGFDPGEGGADDDAVALAPPDGAFVVIMSDRTVVGCGGLQRVDDDTGEVKRMWIDHDWRGLGLGHRLLARLEGLAADHGRSRIILDTNEVLSEAIAMYQQAGYEPIERYNDNPYAHHWFARELDPPNPANA